MEGDETENREESQIRLEYEAVCSKLNMDQQSMEDAWSSYASTRDYYTLEVSPLFCLTSQAGHSLRINHSLIKSNLPLARLT